MKIVINTRHGCFDLPPRLMRLYIEEKYSHIADYLIEQREEWGMTNFYVFGKIFCVTDRTDSALVKLVEDNLDECDTMYAKLKIVEIPNDVDWELKQHAGAEWIAEKHRTWN